MVLYMYRVQSILVYCVVEGEIYFQIIADKGFTLFNHCSVIVNIPSLTGLVLFFFLIFYQYFVPTGQSQRD